MAAVIYLPPLTLPPSAYEAPAQSNDPGITPQERTALKKALLKELPNFTVTQDGCESVDDAFNDAMERCVEKVFSQCKVEVSKQAIITLHKDCEEIWPQYGCDMPEYVNNFVKSVVNERFMSNETSGSIEVSTTSKSVAATGPKASVLTSSSSTAASAASVPTSVVNLTK